MTVRGLLLAGASVCALGMGSAFAASAPKVHVTAMRPGHAVVKTQAHRSGIKDATTYTLSVSTGISASASYKMKTDLPDTFYAIEYSTCSEVAKEKVSFPMGKKTAYAKLAAGTETGTPSGCSAPVTFYGTVYDLTAKKASGSTDSFPEVLVAKGGSGKNKFTFTLNLDVAVAISP